MASSSNVFNRTNWSAANHRRGSNRPVYSGLDALDLEAMNEGLARKRSLNSTAGGVSHSVLGKKKKKH